MQESNMPNMPMMSPMQGFNRPMNGNMPGLMAPLSPMYSREDIVEMVNQHERDTDPLRVRMDKDFDLYRLTTHINRDHETGDALENYATYTTSAPRVFADKVISWQVMAELLIRAPHMDAGGHPEEADNFKERFAIGCLKAADERLIRKLQASLRGQLASYVTIRGGYVGGRCLLVKNPMTGKTYADITAWDPMHIHWGIGADGLEWACYKIKMTRTQIWKEYGVDLRRDSGGLLGRIGNIFRGSSDAEKEGVYVYDFYDGQRNTVVTDGETLKPPTPHGSPRVPIYLVLVGPMPLLQSTTATNLVSEVGESVFAGAREIYEKYSDVMSIFLEIVERARRQTVVMESPDGKKTLPEDPFIHPTMIGVRTGDKIYTLTLQEMARETMAYVTQILGEIQRATLPFSAYGETPFQLSGFAITQLRQATETVLSSRIEALTQAYTQIVNLLYDQFMTGAFDGMQLSGRDSSRAYFNQAITPEMIQNTCDYTVKLVSQLPQDDMSKWTTAKMAKELRLQSDVDILDNIVGVQDAQQAIDKVRAQMAEESLPEAQLLTMAMAAASLSVAPGDQYDILAKMYTMEYQRMMFMKQMQMMSPPTDQGGGKGQSTPPKSGGQPPQVQPNAATGAPPQPETSNQGPSLVAPGTPRPGAQGQP